MWLRWRNVLWHRHPHNRGCRAIVAGVALVVVALGFAAWRQWWALVVGCEVLALWQWGEMRYRDGVRDELTRWRRRYES